MSLAEYTVPATDGVRVRHDAKARLTVKTGRQTLEDDLTPVDVIGGAITRVSFTYNRLSMSGGTAWWNPSTGATIIRPKVQIRLRPSDVLADGALCPCPACAQ